MDYSELSKALNTKALTDEDRTGRHIKYYAVIEGVRRLVTVMSHGAKGQISRGRRAEMARQMHLSTRQLQQFVDCTLSREEWLDLWENATRQR